ncbi:hypothetical protein DPMN_048307 [Dreissena polymorpha]|uniref:Uncharacterized protein n=1 Tax=Dreissena polymorpha TaxID=45954 RepID=A0A9D4DBD2_DREPO|nr:hypothetical protein DPMN_048307 [Dreissena polymorpha]
MINLSIKFHDPRPKRGGSVNSCMGKRMYSPLRALNKNCTTGVPHKIILREFTSFIRSTRSSPTKRSGTGLGGRETDREALGKWSCISRVEDRVDREAIVHMGSPKIGKMSCGGRVLSTRVELGRVWSGNFGDRNDRVDRIGSEKLDETATPKKRIIVDSHKQQSTGPVFMTN